MWVLPPIDFFSSQHPYPSVSDCATLVTMPSDITRVLHVRVSPATAALVAEKAKADHRSTSSWLRLAIEAMVAKEEVKA